MRVMEEQYNQISVLKSCFMIMKVTHKAGNLESTKEGSVKATYNLIM